jgi:hypothetical protein
VLFVCHPCGHGRMLASSDDGYQWKTGEREDRGESSQSCHAPS